MTLQFFTPLIPRTEAVRIPPSCRRTVRWLPQIGDIFPDFDVQTTDGPLRFWDWAAGSWIHLFSHPAAYTPVCTTEMVSISSCADAWNKNNIKHLALTGSSVKRQQAWHAEIERIFGTAICFPGAHDPGLQTARQFGMVHEKESRGWPIRKSFIIDPALRVQMIFEYPVYVGRCTEEILRVIKALQLRADTGAATPADWYGGDVAIIPDDRPEAEVIDEFGTGSISLTGYLRLVDPKAANAQGTT